METRANNYFETQPIGALMRRYAIPCIISLLVAALYNIEDQLFIANASDLGSYGNAANTVVFQLTVVALAIAVMIGDGCCEARLPDPKRAPPTAESSSIKDSHHTFMPCSLSLWRLMK